MEYVQFSPEGPSLRDDVKLVLYGLQQQVCARFTPAPAHGSSRLVPFGRVVHSLLLRRAPASASPASRLPTPLTPRAAPGTQATFGKNTSPRPSFWNTEDVARWDSWKEAENLSKTDAMFLYVRTVDEYAPTWMHWSGLADMVAVRFSPPPAPHAWS